MEAILPAIQPRRKPTFADYDSLDDRREIVTLLNRLPPAKRLAFDDWCCALARLHHTIDTAPRVTQKTRELAELANRDSSASEMLTREVYKDVLFLSFQYYFDLNKAVAELVRRARAS